MVAKTIFKRVLGNEEGEGFIASAPLTRFKSLNAEPNTDDADPSPMEQAEAASSESARLATKRLSRFKNQHTRDRSANVDDTAPSARALSQNAARAQAQLQARELAQAKEWATQAQQPPAPPQRAPASPVAPSLSTQQMSNEGAEEIPVQVVMQALSHRLAR